MAGTIACDRVTKHVAASTLAGVPGRSYLADVLRLEYAENSGGFLSVGADLPPTARTVVFTIGTGLMLLGALGAVLHLRLGGWPLIGAGLFASGAASNWIDRLIHGSVVDFLNLGVGSLRTGIFNVADVAIISGAAILVLSELRRSRGTPS